VRVAGAVCVRVHKGQGVVSGSHDDAARVVEHAADRRLLYGEAGRMGQYTFAFEIASLLLLVAILGAVIMTKKKI
jgi:hypothetical protein